MRKFRSEAYEAIYDNVVANFEDGLYTETEMRKFEADCFIDEDETPANSLAMATEHETT